MSAPKIQEEISHAPFTSRQLVLSGPGTGKTYCLIERLKFLCKNAKLVPGADILVLTFSVAANKEIKSRLLKAVESGECDESLLYTNIRTFDSFASQLLLNVNAEIELKGTGYDDRIRIAIDCLKTEKDAQSLVSKYRHVLIDEIQDLVGIRAQFVKCILANLSEGFSLFGDPAQGIYDYLIEDESEGPTSGEFLSWLLSAVPNLSIRDELTVNYRVGFNFDLEQMALKGRKLIFDGKPLIALRQLYKTFSALECCGRLNDPRIPADSSDSNIAVLCRTNGQVLCVARKLFELGVRFSIRHRIEERLTPSWVGRAFCERDGRTFEKRQFTTIFEEQCNTSRLSSENAWLLLKETEGGRAKNSIDVLKLRHALLFEKTPSDSTDEEDDHRALILSTIHRSKGREFDTVIAIMPDSPTCDEGEAAQEAKVLYVAMTRAKKRLLRMTEEGAKGFRKIDSEDRWVRAFGGKFTGIEVGMERDVDPHSFVSTKIHEEDIQDIRENQHDLWKFIRRFMPARLSLFDQRKGIPIYRIEINRADRHIVVGGTSTAFGRSLKNCLEEVKGKRIRSDGYPRIIDHIWVRRVVTYVGDLGEEEVPRVFRSTGLWLGIRLEGMGQCHWD